MPPTDNGTVVCIGTFDGVHIGHQAILRRVRTEATERGLESIAYAFDAPPRWTRAGKPTRTLLLPRSIKRGLLEIHVDRAIPVSLAEVRNLQPEEFAETVLAEQLHAQLVVVGENFRFGRERAGNVETLRDLGTRLGFDSVTIAPVEAAGGPVSSTRIRQLLADGHVAEAAVLLGRPSILVGMVESGDRLGRSFGYPTANLEIDSHELMPSMGIYLIHAFCLGTRYDGLLYIGNRPTVGGSAMRCEVHLVAAGGPDLYGASMEVHLLEFIREDQAFDSPEALRSQIELDIIEARSRFPRYATPTTPFSG